MIFDFPEAHEMQRKGNIFTCPHCDRCIRFSDGRLEFLAKGNPNAQHYYFSEGVEIGVNVRVQK